MVTLKFIITIIFIKILKNYKILSKSGCIIQDPDGSMKVFPPEEAEEYFQSLPKSHMKKYTVKSSQIGE